ncbi:MAG: LamG domain-containing protein, partial [Planctomycetota bacterium]
MKERMIVVVMALCFVISVTGITQQASAADEMPGLIGIQYGSEDFSDAEDLVRLSSLDQTWGEDARFGKQWAGKWQGFIVAPATAEVRFTIETNQDAKIEIAGKVVLNSKSGLTAGSMKMVKGKKYPIVLTYVKEGSEYDCALKVQWGWAGQTPITIEGDSLVHSPQTEAELNVIVQANDDGDDDGDDDEEEGDGDNDDVSVGLVDGVVLPSSDVVGLWLFDEFTYPHTTFTDASEYAKADLHLMEGGRMDTGKYGRALEVIGTDYALCYAGFSGKVAEEELRERDGTPSGLWGPTEGPEAVLGGLAGNTWTIELWINLSSVGGNITIIDMGQAYDPGLSLTFNGSVFELKNYYAGVKATCPTRLSTGGWHHAAFTRDGSTVRFYLDGTGQAVSAVSSISVQPTPDLQKPKDREHESRGFETMDFEQRRQNRFNLAIGSDRHAKNLMRGKIDEMRISRVVQYSANFSPKSFSRNYGVGAPRPSAANGPPLLFDPEPVSVPLKFGARKYVFIDDAIIDKRVNMQITMNHPYGKQSLVKDFRLKKSSLRPSVFDVDGVIFMTMPESYSSNEGLTFLATSPDGLSFTMKGRIIPETPMYGSFFKDLNPNVTAAEQYKVNAFVGNRGMYFYMSGDGINWRRNETIQLPLRSGGEGECYWDDQRGRYVSYIKRDSSFNTKEYPRTGHKGHRAPMFATNEILKAWPFKALSKPYFEGWPFPAVTGEGQEGFVAQEYGGVYRTRAIKYPWAPDVYLAFIWRYPGDDKARHTELAVSRNGEDWSLFGRNWYIPIGPTEEELSMYGLIRRGDEIWQYVDEGGAHGGDEERSYYRYKQRLDGFVSLDAGSTTATATTLPLKFQGSKLVLNIKATGSAKVAITDKNGKVIPGFDFDDCDHIKGDFVEKTVTWKGNGNVKALAGKTVRLKFQMQNTKLY